MLYGGNYGRTTYGGIVRRVASAVGNVLHKGVSIILSRFKGKNQLLTKRNPAIIKSKGVRVILRTTDGIKQLKTGNKKALALGSAKNPIFMKTGNVSPRLSSSNKVITLKIKSKKGTLGSKGDTVITKSTSRANPSVL